MKQIIQVYGEFLLEGIVIVFLITLVFCGIKDDAGNIGVFAILGEGIELERIEHLAYRDFVETYKAECEKSAPLITFLGLHLQTGLVKLSDYITAQDYAGNSIPMIVKSIKNAVGTEFIDSYNVTSTEINFVQAGIYTILIEAMDESYRTTTCTIQIPVNK